MSGRILICAFLGVTSLLPYTAAGDEGLPAAFRAYVELRRAEEEHALAEAQGGRESAAEEWKAKAHEAKAAFRAHEKDPALTAWDRKALSGIGKRHAGEDKTALDFLTRNFPKARDWSPLEWQAVGEWFGRATEDAFLQVNFAMAQAQGTPEAGSRPVAVWVSDPFAKYQPHAELEAQKKAQEEAFRRLRAQGYSVEEIFVSPYAQLEQQAEELHLALRKKAEGGPFTLVSAGTGSAVLLRTFDLHPSLLGVPEIRGWVNLNGQLYGRPRTWQERAPASRTKADRQHEEARQLMLSMQRERIAPQTPLGAQFPVVNLVTVAGGHRPAEHLRESLIPDGRTVLVKEGAGYGELLQALPRLRAPASAPTP